MKEKVAGRITPEGVESTTQRVGEDGRTHNFYIRGKDAKEHAQMKALIDSEAMPNMEGGDRAQDDDRLWFEQHPKKEFRLRRNVEGENGAPADLYWVLVFQMFTGVRQRIGLGPEWPVEGILAQYGGHLPRAVAAEILSVMTNGMFDDALSKTLKERNKSARAAMKKPRTTP